MNFHSISQILKNYAGFKTSRKMIVIESDDWGSIRMPSREVRDYLTGKGADFTNDRYNRLETMESNDDLAELFEVLSSFTDHKGNHPVITAVNVVANPDFEKIKTGNFEFYHYEPFTETLKRYPHHDKVYDLWNKGIEKRLFVPQFHGREHLNVCRWMRALRAGSPGEMEAFNLGVTGLHPAVYSPFRSEYQGAFELDQPKDLEYQKTVITEGIALFEELLGYKPTVFIPTNGPMSSRLEPVLQQSGIRGIQTARMIYKEPLGNGRVKTRFRYMGKKNRLGQYYLLRNCVFEPSEIPGLDWASKCLSEIETIFRFHKPVVITTHRVNYSGEIDPQNRKNGLLALKKLLNGILTKWPDAEFITTGELVSLM